MTRYYQPGSRGKHTDAARPVEIPLLQFIGRIDPASYQPDEALIDAVNVSLVLGLPLLVTGEPGTGKTHLAYSVAWELGLASPLIFETKSNSVSRDLFYGFDTVGRFHAAQTRGVADPQRFISFNALGLAIVRANASDALPSVLSASTHALPQRSVVLIDEIDKAPRDFPNDILNEIENMYFRVPELENIMVTAPDNLRPIVILTSNSEKGLPDAFLRRCAFFHIPFPSEVKLESIVLSRLESIGLGKEGLLADSLKFFMLLRQPETELRKQPGPGELINWISAMVQFGADPSVPLREQASHGARTFSMLAKLADDQERVVSTYKAWLGSAIA
jgi:MoxR-like ATPase